MNETLIDPRKSRFKSADWAGLAQDKTVVIGGAGGIGSHLVFSLQRIGYKVVVYDMDTVEEVNLSNQLYGDAHIGKPKVEAVREVCDYLGAPGVQAMNMKFESETCMVSEITIASFDNMAARKDMFKKWCIVANEKSWKDVVFIDTRMSCETGEVYTIDSVDKAKKYVDKYMFDDSEAPELPCGYKGTTYGGQFIAAITTATLNNWLAINYLDSIRDAPFKMSYMLQSPQLTSTDD